MRTVLFSVSCLVFIAIFPLAAASEGGPAVRTSGGEIRGVLLPGSGEAVFKGIPYAQPPVGGLRWREPLPAKAWHGVRDATEYGAPCAQVAGGWNDRVAAAGSEDCLYLNVWTAEWPLRSRRPVMFWIHGGANMGGSAMGGAGIEPLFDGENLARRGVVVVTINYRVGVFGFLAHPELTAESRRHASGNYGLLDQIAALRWVHDNIARFGGDPSRVTIFGQSAGGMDVGLLMTSPLAKGLFQGAIEQSGTVMIFGRPTRSLAQAEQSGVEFAKKLHAPESGTIRYLRTLSTAAVLAASPPYGGGGPLRPEPDVDGYALTRDPAEVFRSGEDARVPLIIGNNAREMILPGGLDGMNKAIQDFYGTMAGPVRKLYAASTGGNPAYGDAAAQYWTDLGFRCPAVLIAEWHGAKNTTYQYEFTRGAEPQGAVHSLELRYIFGFSAGQTADEADRKLAGQMQAYWTNFAKSGNPNGSGLPAWPTLDRDKREYLELGDDGPVVKSGLRAAHCEPFREKILERMGR